MTQNKTTYWVLPGEKTSDSFPSVKHQKAVMFCFYFEIIYITQNETTY